MDLNDTALSGCVAPRYTSVYLRHLSKMEVEVVCCVDGVDD